MKIALSSRDMERIEEVLSDALDTIHYFETFACEEMSREDRKLYDRKSRRLNNLYDWFMIKFGWMPPKKRKGDEK